MEDEYGDGWAGALPGRVDTWSITQALSESDLTSPVGDGLLPSGHYSAVNSLCLEDGYYTFSSTANAAWSSEASWTVCGVQGASGGTLEFEASWLFVLLSFFVLRWTSSLPSPICRPYPCIALNVVPPACQ